MRVLDLGTGTGNLAVLLTARRLRVWGLDFSRKMLSLVRAKVPEAVFVQGDIAFSTFRGRDTVRRWWHALWDKKEHYWVAKEAVPALKQAGFRSRITRSQVVVEAVSKRVGSVPGPRA